MSLLIGSAKFKLRSDTPANPIFLVPVTSSVRTGQTFNHLSVHVSVSVVTFQSFLKYKMRRVYSER